MDKLKERYLTETGVLFGEVIAIEKMSNGFNMVKAIIDFLE